MSEGARRIAAERERQVAKLDWTAEHDDEHDDESLAMAAACYAAPTRIYVRKVFAAGESFVDPWPWNGGDARPHPNRGNVVAPETATPAQRLRLLEKAGALIAAEIDRLLRAGSEAQGPSMFSAVESVAVAGGTVTTYAYSEEAQRALGAEPKEPSDG